MASNYKVLQVFYCVLLVAALISVDEMECEEEDEKCFNFHPEVSCFTERNHSMNADAAQRCQKCCQKVFGDGYNKGVGCNDLTSLTPGCVCYECADPNKDRVTCDQS
ncbi:hypothetical protein CASFOL_008812 [Castilleja foliolosa]|uniref:Uncharacterized protein n=1 Tax=Castilleja foliolosa TaxID=1961234 RepID=A0ABD3E447_9LAMI